MAFAQPDPKKLAAEARRVRSEEERVRLESFKTRPPTKGRIMDETEKCYKAYVPAQQRGR